MIEIGRKKIDGRIGTPRSSITANSGTNASTRFTTPAIVTDSAKIVFGTRTRFISAPFHAMAAIDVTVVCCMNVHGSSADNT